MRTVKREMHATPPRLHTFADARRTAQPNLATQRMWWLLVEKRHTAVPVVTES